MGCYFRDSAKHDVTTLKARNSAKDLLVGWNSVIRDADKLLLTI